MKGKGVDLGLVEAKVNWVQHEMGKLHTATLPSSGERSPWSFTQLLVQWQFSTWESKDSFTGIA